MFQGGAGWGGKALRVHCTEAKGEQKRRWEGSCQCVKIYGKKFKSTT